MYNIYIGKQFNHHSRLLHITVWGCLKIGDPYIHGFIVIIPIACLATAILRVSLFSETNPNHSTSQIWLVLSH